MENELGQPIPQEAGEPEQLSDDLPDEPEIIEKPVTSGAQDAKHLIHCLTGFHSVGRLMVRPLVRNTKLIYIVICPHFPRQTPRTILGSSLV